VKSLADMSLGELAAFVWSGADLELAGDPGQATPGGSNGRRDRDISHS